MINSNPLNFLVATEKHIVNMFKGLKGAEVLPTPFGDAVYIKGTRDDRVLLVAHTDTVWGNAKIKLKKDGHFVTSAVKDVGIGADDRAGVAALWALRKSGHSLLIVPEEETGCRGSGHIAKNFATVFDERFAIQFDRKGSKDLVFYDGANSEFIEFMEENMVAYEEAVGSFSDICELCPALGIAGVNVSIGFRNEHTGIESLDLADWRRTVTKVSSVLKRPCPFFEYLEYLYESDDDMDLFNYNYGFNTHTQKDEGGYEYNDGYYYDQETLLYCPDCASEVVVVGKNGCPDCGNEQSDMYDLI